MTTLLTSIQFTSYKDENKLFTLNLLIAFDWVMPYNWANQIFCHLKHTIAITHSIMEKKTKYKQQTTNTTFNSLLQFHLRSNKSFD